MYRLRKVGKKERKLLGVVGGISKYVDPTVDPVVWRIIFFVLFCFNPPGMVLLYVLGAFVLKTEEYGIVEKYPILEEDLIEERNEKIKEAADAQREDEKEEKKEKD